jgi:hypothetical protein
MKDAAHIKEHVIATVVMKLTIVTNIREGAISEMKKLFITGIFWTYLFCDIRYRGGMRTNLTYARNCGMDYLCKSGTVSTLFC